MTRKIGKLHGPGDGYGYFPNVFSAIMNRALVKHRANNATIDDDLIKDLFERATEIKARFVRRYGECE